MEYLLNGGQVPVAISIKSHDLCCKWTQRARVQDPEESSGYLFNKSAYIPTPWNLLVPVACIREDNSYPFISFSEASDNPALPNDDVLQND